MIWSILLVLVSAFLWRVRGGLIQDLTGQPNFMGMNDTVVRLIYALGVAAVFGAAYGFDWHIAVLALALFIACTIGWFGADHGLGNPSLGQVGLISMSGFVRGVIIGVSVLSPPTVIAGSLAGPVCWISARLPVVAKGWVWEEILFGALLGASLIKFHVGILTV